MKKVLIVICLMFCLTSFVGCGFVDNTVNTPPNIETEDKEDLIDNEDNEVLNMKIDGNSINILWEDNQSVKELKEYAKNGLTIQMQRYGGFEQVGSLGKTITSNNSTITTVPGDVVLYSSNQIVIFFGTNTWSYTKLGHINLNQAQLESLLDKQSVNLYIGQ